MLEELVLREVVGTAANCTSVGVSPVAVTAERTSYVEM